MKEIKKGIKKHMEIVKPPLEKTEEEKKMEAAREEFRKRARAVVANCAFTAMPLSEHATQACRTIEMIFEEATQEIALLLPGEFRTALCLEHLETACMYAKKAIAIHDSHVRSLAAKERELEKANESDPNKN